MSDEKNVLLSQKIDDVLLLTMNRPARHNAINAALNHALGEAVARADADGVKVIVLTGAGNKAFCAGNDMLEMSGVEENSLKEIPASERKDGYLELPKTPLPVIAAIDGYCYGGGTLLALACDIRLATPRSSFRWPGAEYGLVVGASSLPRLVGAAKAKEWILTARKVEADEALGEGMLNTLYSETELLDKALEMAKTIAGHSTAAVRNSKRVINLASLSEDAIKAEAEMNKNLIGSAEQSERFRSATEKVTGR